MKITFCTIATDKYIRFFEGWKQSIKDLVLPLCEKHFILFTDVSYDGSDTSVVKINHLPWPLNTLLRFNYIHNELPSHSMDYVYYMDVDCHVVNLIGEEILPPIGQLVAVEHPWQHENSEIYERNINSTACVIDNKGIHYFQGCFFGGHMSDVIKMVTKLNENINKDLSHNYIAIWHDESHLNKYFIENPPKQLNCGYAYPDPKLWQQTLDVEQKIIHRNNHAVP